jgi:hypothetical protein
VRLGPRARRLALTLHVGVSVGWLGAVLAFLVLAVRGLRSADPVEVQASYIAMDLVAWQAILPLSLASLASGLVQGLGTPWGVLRHYWVAAKLLITLAATAFLLLHLQPVAHLGEAAREGPLDEGGHAATRLQLVVNAAGAAAGLACALLLSVLKPKGLTRRGRRHLAAQKGAQA